MRPWGKLGKFYGVYMFGLSPFEQKAFGTFGQDMMKMGRTAVEYWWAFLSIPAFVALRDYGMKMEDQRLRKDPQKFVNDQ